MFMVSAALPIAQFGTDALHHLAAVPQVAELLEHMNQGRLPGGVQVARGQGRHTGGGRLTERGEAKPVEPVLDNSLTLSLLNGVSRVAGNLPDGVTVTRLAEKLTDGSFAPALEPRGPDDAIGALNSAFVGDGYFVDIADGTELEKPIELQNIQAGGLTHVRLPVRVGANVKATIVQHETGSGAGLISSVSNLLIGEGSDVLWLIVQDQPDSAIHLGQFNAEIGKNAKLTLFVMNMGGRLVRQEVRVKAAGEGSDFQLRGVNLLAGETHTDVTMVLDHAVPHTGSRELVRNIVTGKAHGVFQGRINVHQPAQKTDAKMACNTLLLSDAMAVANDQAMQALMLPEQRMGIGASKCGLSQLFRRQRLLRNLLVDNRVAVPGNLAARRLRLRVLFDPLAVLRLVGNLGRQLHLHEAGDLGPRDGQLVAVE